MKSIAPIHALFAPLVATLLVGCASAPPAAVPPALAPPAPQVLAMTIAAKGVQVYECRSTDAAAAQAAPQWAFVAPEATLWNADGHAIGSHGAGPHWAFDDGARILGRVKARADATTPDAIPWLLLEARAEPLQGGQPHRFAGLRSIQRINTQGGVAPTAGCDASRIGSQVRVPYTADYLFYAAH